MRVRQKAKRFASQGAKVAIGAMLCVCCLGSISLSNQVISLLKSPSDSLGLSEFSRPCIERNDIQTGGLNDTDTTVNMISERMATATAQQGAALYNNDTYTVNIISPERKGTSHQGGAHNDIITTSYNVTIDPPFDFGSPASHLWSIFYNVYIPPSSDDAGVKHAMLIIEEQLQRVRKSHAAVKTGNVTVYYNTIGGPGHTTEISQLCSNYQIDCRHMQHYEEGNFEEITLERVSEFCRVHEEQRVMYMHSKGSYHMVHSDSHHDVSQDHWRRHMMRAITGKICLEPPVDSCDVCGLLALPWPALHFAGNFWVSKCSMVNKLIPPKSFISAMNRVVAKSLYLRAIYWRFVAKLLPDTPWHFGTDRYASEQWIASHPSVKICDVSKRARVEYWQVKSRGNHAYEWAMFPRHVLSWTWSYTGQGRPFFETTLETPSLRFREWYLLSGFLFKWYELYNEAPPPTSWAWDWFPDGHQWRDAVQTYGRGALVAMTKEYAKEDHHWATSGIPHRKKKLIA
jgi:hypothetical protein